METEADVELRLVLPLLHALGYENEDISAKHPVEFREGRAGRKPEADFVCFAGSSRDKHLSLLAVEAKKPGEALPAGKEQGESYARNQLAPALLLTNGDELEVWQLNTLQESMCELNIPIKSLLQHRAKIEQLLARESLIAYRASFPSRTVLENSVDYGTYERAELARSRKYAASIDRTLARVRAGQQDGQFSISRLVEEFRQGAIILASSGVGKTTLSGRLLHDSIEARLAGRTSLLPFDVPLPDLLESNSDIIEFLHARLSAHCPWVSRVIVQTLLRQTGALLLCDGFDRVPELQQATINAQLSNFVRDFPKAQLFVFSRRVPRLATNLPLLELKALTNPQMRELERDILGKEYENASVLSALRPMLFELCRTPLLLEHTLEYYKSTRSLPDHIVGLFELWLSGVLEAEPNDIVSSIEREQAMTLIAQATLTAPLAGRSALTLLTKHGLKPEVLNDLASCGAVRVTGSVIELQHEALADYLRAGAAASRDDLRPEQLALLPISDDSFFPILLMALLPTSDLQSAWWERLALTSIQIYGDALRYRLDLSSTMDQLGAEDLSRKYLEELLAGLELPLAGLFPQLRNTCAELLVGDPRAAFAVSGAMDPGGPSVSFRLHPHVAVDQPRACTPDGGGPGVWRGMQLGRVDSARLVGAQLLKETVLKTVHLQQVNGGQVWAAERLIGRVRYLEVEYGFALSVGSSLDEIETALLPHCEKVVGPLGFGGQEAFSIRSMLDDVATLQAASVRALDPWWRELGWNEQAMKQTDETIARVLNEHYRRVQFIYAEIVAHSFSKIAPYLNLASVLPLRWIITAVRREAPWEAVTLHYRLLPVGSWDEAGADLSFSDQGPTVPDPQEFRQALARLGRPSSTSFGRFGFTQLPSQDGRDWTGRFDGATSVVHEVSQELTHELENLFSAFPNPLSWVRGK